MNRIIIGIITAFALIISVTAMNYTPDSNSPSTCEVKKGCDKSASKCDSKRNCNKKSNCDKGNRDSCKKDRNCDKSKSSCKSKSNCEKKSDCKKGDNDGCKKGGKRYHHGDCDKPCCKKDKQKEQCGVNCTKPCCAGK